MENFKCNNKAFIMPTGVFDPFRTSWFECSSCRNPLFEKHIMSKIPHICPHCGVSLENIICDEQAFHILYKTGEIVDVNKDLEGQKFMENLTLKEYEKKIPMVEIDGRTYVDKELFKGYTLHLLTQELKDELSSGEQIGIETAINIIANIE